MVASMPQPTILMRVMSEFDPMSRRTLSHEARDAAAREVVTVIAGNLDAALPFKLIG
jgi:hypothetical protein